MPVGLLVRSACSRNWSVLGTCKHKCSHNPSDFSLGLKQRITLCKLKSSIKHHVCMYV